MTERPAENQSDHDCYLSSDAGLRAIAEASGLRPGAAEAIARIDATMGRIRRNIVRREFGRQILAEIGSDLEVAHMDVLGSIWGSPGHGRGGREDDTVGLVAERLGTDPSRASRLVSEVVELGYARRTASQGDARRICLELTEQGRGLMEAIRTTKWRLFAASLGQWSEAELVEFAKLLDRFSRWTAERPSVLPTDGQQPAQHEPAAK